MRPGGRGRRPRRISRLTPSGPPAPAIQHSGISQGVVILGGEPNQMSHWILTKILPRPD